MKMKTIAFYVTDLGFGHLTRSLAIIEQVLEKFDEEIYLACGELQIEYARVFLHKYSDRVSYQIVNTEAKNMIKKDSFEMDRELTTQSVQDFLGTLEEKVNIEVEMLKGRDLGLIVTDISLLGIQVAKALGKKVIGISNYTNYHRYKKLGLPESILELYLKAYNSLDLFFEYPYADSLEGLTCGRFKVGMVARKVNRNASADFKSRAWPSCFLSIGQVADIERIEVDFPGGHIYATGNVNVEGNAHVIKLPRRIGHSQDYVAASSMAIIKPGWAAVAECMISGIPIGVIGGSPIEDGEIIEKLMKDNACFLVTEEELRKLSIRDINMKAAKVQTKKAMNDAPLIAELLIRQYD